MADKYTPNKAPNGNTYLRDWWNKVVETNFSTIFQVFSKHIVGSGDRHTADTVDFDSETTVEEKINTEIADRENGDKELADDLNAEVQAREENNEQLRDLINTERINRESNDALKANVTDVLTKNNTDSYSPTSNYHPATKKYVDDIAINSGAGDMLRAVYDMDGSGVVDDAEKLGGVEAEKYALQTQIEEIVGKTYETTLIYNIENTVSRNFTKLVGMSSTIGAQYEETSSIFIQKNGMNYNVTIGETITDNLIGGTIIQANCVTTSGQVLTPEYVNITFECQDKGLIETTLNTPPELTATSPDGTMIGSDGWTGTGFVCTAEDTKYEVISSDMSSRIVGFNRFCLRFADVSGNKWKNWSPWLDIDGVTYEFFYSPARKLYEALIPATTKTAEEIVSSIRWERAEPDVIRYGKLSSMMGSYVTTSTGSDGSAISTTEYYPILNDEISIRDCSGAYNYYDAQFLFLAFMGSVEFDSSIDINLISKVWLRADLNCDGRCNNNDMTQIPKKIQTSTVFTVETIDNFA